MRKPILFCLLAFLLPFAVSAQSPGDSQSSGGAEGDLTRLLRYPDVHGTQIAFVYAGDLWLASTEGGPARRLTSHAGEELVPKFSPDGRHIAFTGEYGGTRQVFVIPTEGGEPRQLTYQNDVGAMPPRGGFDHRVLGWSPDGEDVLFLANRTPWMERKSRPYLISKEGGMPRPLPIVESGSGSLSPDGKRFAFTPQQREFRTWKRYQGGQAQDLWLFDLDALEAVRVTDFPGTDNQPMWLGDQIYFASDRDGKMNLYRLPASATSPVASPEQITRHDTFDLAWPSSGPGPDGGDAIVYEHGGYIHLLDTASGESRRVPIRVTGDFAGRVPYFRTVDGNFEGGSLSPSGARIALAARGEIFTLPAGPGRTRNLTRSQGVRERGPAWSPDGQHIAYWSDRSGEYELYVRPQGSTDPDDERRVTDGVGVWSFDPVWSPDSKHIAFGDTNLRLRVVEVASGKITEIDQASGNSITDYTWSPDSRWIAYTKASDDGIPSIWVHSMTDGRSRQLTDDWYADFNPVFDPKGRYLYFLSNRDYNLTFSGYESNYLYTEPTRAYVGLLTEDVPAPYPFATTEEPAGKKDEKNGDEGGNGEDRSKKTEIQVEGFTDRVRALPGPADNYRSLQAAPDSVYVLRGNGPAQLVKTGLEEEKSEVIMNGVINYQVTPDGSKLTYFAGGKLGVTAPRADLSPGEGEVSMKDMVVKIDPQAEWRQMYHDAWRLLRDWFYDPAMPGLDWEEVRDRYEPLVDHLASREDLDYIFAELAGELEAGHAYVQPSGDPDPVERREGGMLGAEIEAHSSGFFRITNIFPGENWHEAFRSPLTEPGVDVSEGDFILAVDGRPTSEVKNIYQLLEDTADTVVVLTVNDEPQLSGAREVKVRPVPSELYIRQLEWIAERRQKAAEASGGRIGYVYLPNTAVDGNRELHKTFLPQAGKDAMIFDDRYNGGGFIPDRMIELVSRPVLNYWVARNQQPVATPAISHRGPKATLINGYAGSGGDAWPYYFRELGLGPLIGTRTWGGLIGVSGSPGLVDGGQITAPAFRFMSTEGQWEVEGEGVAPDIEVIDRPDALARGEDPSLERAIEYLLEQLETRTPEPVPNPASWGGAGDGS